MDRLKSEFRLVLNVHHLVNIALSLAFIASKMITVVCHQLYGHDYGKCSFDTREHEILVFLGVVIVWKNRKSSSLLYYLSTIYMYTKLASIFLFFRGNPLAGLVYSAVCIACYVMFPEPIYPDSDRVIFFHGEGLQRELGRDKSIVWVIEFFTSWSSECRYMSPTFSQLSERYSLSNLKFGKLDVGKYAKEAERFRINAHPMSKQLPSIAIFKDGVQVNRRPLVGPNQRAIPFVFNEENCIHELGLNNLYSDCKARVGKHIKANQKSHAE